MVIWELLGKWNGTGKASHPPLFVNAEQIWVVTYEIRVYYSRLLQLKLKETLILLVNKLIHLEPFSKMRKSSPK